MLPPCPDHGVPATLACADCGRSLCDACPVQQGAPRCQSCQLKSLDGPPTRKEVDRSAGLLFLKVMGLIVATCLLGGWVLSSCLSCVGRGIHT